MKKLIIFGTEKTAELAHYYFTKDSDYDVIGFTVNEKYKHSDEFQGLPVYDFEKIEYNFSVDEIDLFIAITFNEMNELRQRKAKEAKDKGFRLASYISSKAIIFDNVKIGEHCFILESNVIQPFVEIGDNNILWSGNHIGHHAKIGNNNFITSHVAIGGSAVIGDNCFIGGNSSIRDDIEIADYTLIGASTYINRSTKPNEVYKGVNAKLSRVLSNQIIISK